LDVPGVRDRLESYSAASGLDLIGHGTKSDADTIRDTAVAQPLIVGAGLAALPALLGPEHEALPLVGLLAGHSVGEFTATAAAGVVTAEESVSLVSDRGRAMAWAAAFQPTGMSAVVGGDPTDVDRAIDRHGLVAANANGPGQVVAAGTKAQLASLMAAPPPRAKVVPLQVAGAFHSDHMRPAVPMLETAASLIRPKNAAVDLVSNRDGQPVRHGRDVVRRLVDQVARPVRWDLVMETLVARGVTAILELPPAGTLVGLAKRGVKGAKTLALKTPDDLDAARALVAEHGRALVGGPTR
jgi:[acyl-carrier-protein] S-malonyltransferase